jgi:small-conductance mechanosensitive channel
MSQLAQVAPFTLFGKPFSLDDLFLVTVGLYFWVVSVSILERLFVRLITFGTPLKPETTAAAAILMRYGLIGVGIVGIVDHIGVSPTALAAVTGGLSVGIGFGLQQVISNFLSGILLLFEGALKPGDIINVDGAMSEVQTLGIRSTLVRVLTDNSEKIIPNQKFLTSDVTTYTGSDRRVSRSLKVGASYKCDPQTVIALLLQVAQQHPQVLQTPAPVAYFVNFGASSLEFELRFWLSDPIGATRVVSELGCAIWQTLAAHNIDIPFPQGQSITSPDAASILTHHQKEKS